VDPMTAHELIDDAMQAKRRTRGDRRASSVPLLAFGAVTLVDALLRTVVDPFRGDLLLLLLVPAVFLGIALYYRHRETKTGVGARTRAYVFAAVVTVVCLPFVVLFGVFALIGLALLVIALKQRNVYLGAWAVVYGVLGGLESFYLISNRLYAVSDVLGFARAQDGYFSWASSLVYGALGALLIGAGVYAYKSELAAP
jgi:hypothetical protein